MSNFLNFLIRHSNTNYDIWYIEIPYFKYVMSYILSMNSSRCLITHSDQESSAITEMIKIEIIIHGLYAGSWTLKITRIYKLLILLGIDNTVLCCLRDRILKIRIIYYVIEHFFTLDFLKMSYFVKKWRISKKSMQLIRETIYSQFGSCC